MLKSSRRLAIALARICFSPCCFKLMNIDLTFPISEKPSILDAFTKGVFLVQGCQISIGTGEYNLYLTIDNVPYKHETRYYYKVFTNSEGSFIDKFNKMMEAVSQEKDCNHYIYLAKLVKNSWLSKKIRFVEKQLKCKQHPHYPLMLEIAKKIESDYPGVQARVRIAIRTHYFFKHGVSDLCVVINKSESCLLIQFFSPLSGMKSPDKQTKYGLFSAENISYLMNGKYYKTNHTVEEVMQISNGLKAIELKSQPEYDEEYFSSLFSMNDGAFEAPIEGNVSVAF